MWPFGKIKHYNFQCWGSYFETIILNRQTTVKLMKNQNIVKNIVVIFIVDLYWSSEWTDSQEWITFSDAT